VKPRDLGAGTGVTHVLQYVPPSMYRRRADRRARLGWWELLTVADAAAGNPPADGWSLDGPRELAAADLTAWAGGLLGCPVNLAAAGLQMRPRVWGRWRPAPGYTVRPAPAARGGLAEQAAGR